MNLAYYIAGALIALWLIVKTHRRLHRRGKIICVNEDNCTGCKKCLKYCRRNVLETVKDEKRTHIVVKNPANCTACGDCLSACKFNALELVKLQKKN